MQAFPLAFAGSYRATVTLSLFYTASLIEAGGVLHMQLPDSVVLASRVGVDTETM